MEYGDRIRVIKGVSSSSALTPAVGVEGKVIRMRPGGMVTCDFMPPFPLHGGGTACYDEDARPIRIYFKPEEIEIVLSGA
jgi:hypothetical protein